MSVNKVILVGNLGKDPEVRYVNDNNPVANFSVATSESYKDKNGEWQEVTEWHNVVAWRGLAERAEKYLKKGKQVYVEGKIRTRSWDDKEGNKRYTTEIVADTLQILGKREEGDGGDNNENSGYSGGSSRGQQGGSQYGGGQQERSQPSSSKGDSTNVEIDDDLPF